MIAALREMAQIQNEWEESWTSKSQSDLDVLWLLGRNLTGGERVAVCHNVHCETYIGVLFLFLLSLAAHSRPSSSFAVFSCSVLIKDILKSCKDARNRTISFIMEPQWLKKKWSLRLHHFPARWVKNGVSPHLNLCIDFWESGRSGDYFGEQRWRPSLLGLFCIWQMGLTKMEETKSRAYSCGT